jgi:hypothetical protein
MSTPNPYKQVMDDLFRDPVKLKAFMRKVTGPPHITLEGKDKEQALLILALIEPFETTNNQHSWTDSYMIGKTEYRVTTFSDSNEPVVDKMLIEDEE